MKDYKLKMKKVVDFELFFDVDETFSGPNQKANFVLPTALPEGEQIELRFKVRSETNTTFSSYTTITIDQEKILTPVLLFSTQGNETSQVISYSLNAMLISYLYTDKTRFRMMWGPDYGTTNPKLSQIRFRTYKYETYT